MENAINKQFQMNQGAHAENNTETSFRNHERVAQAGGVPMIDNSGLNDGHSTLNYGSPLPDAGHGTKPSKDDGHTHTKQEVYDMAMNKVKKQLENSGKKKNPTVKMGIGSSYTSGKNILGG